MSLNYSLTENHLTSDPDDYRAIVHTRGTASVQRLADEMIKEGSTLSREVILANLDIQRRAVLNLLLDGWRVATPLAALYPRLPGTFDGPDDSFDPARHRVDLGATPVADLRGDFGRSVTLNKVREARVRPEPERYIDVNSGTANNVLTPGGFGRLLGDDLKFDPTDTQQGIFFVATDGTETRAAPYASVKPTEVFFGVPDALPTGEYTLLVRAAPRDGSIVREGELEATLTVLISVG